MSRVALIGIIVENTGVTDRINAVLSDYRDIIIGRMGLPYRQRDIGIISVCVDGPEDMINALSGKIGSLPGVTTKTVYSNVINDK